MYVRMTNGRDCGEVKDFQFEDAQAMIRSGQAAAVDFSQPDPLDKRELALPQSAVAEIPAPQAELRVAEVASPSAKFPITKPDTPFEGRKFDGKNRQRRP